MKYIIRSINTNTIYMCTCIYSEAHFGIRVQAVLLCNLVRAKRSRKHKKKYIYSIYNTFHYICMEVCINKYNHRLTFYFGWTEGSIRLLLVVVAVIWLLLWLLPALFSMDLRTKVPLLLLGVIVGWLLIVVTSK